MARCPPTSAPLPYTTLFRSIPQPLPTLPERISAVPQGLQPGHDAFDVRTSGFLDLLPTLNQNRPDCVLKPVHYRANSIGDVIPGGRDDVTERLRLLPQLDQASDQEPDRSDHQPNR